MNKIVVYIIFSLFLKIGHASGEIPIGDSSQVHNCTLKHPSWWYDVHVSLPDSINSIEDLQFYCAKFKDSLIIIKLWYIGMKKMDLFAAHIGDQWFKIGEYNEAISFYKSILPCTTNEKGRGLEWESYLFYKIGKCYEEKNEKDLAVEWYRKAIDQKYTTDTPKTMNNYQLALCAYRCLMNIRCDK